MIWFPLLASLVISIQGPIYNSAGVVSNPPASPLVKQNFEGTGYDNSETWSEFSGGAGETIDEDYATGPLLGSQSLRVVSTDTFTFSYTKIDHTSLSEEWFFTMLKMAAVNADGKDIMADVDGGGAIQISVGVSGGHFQVKCGSASATTSLSYSTGTLYYLWGHYLKGSGANAVAEIWVSTTSTKPADASSGTASVTTGTSTANVQEFSLGYRGTDGGTPDIQYDHVYVDDAVILSNP